MTQSGDILIEQRRVGAYLRITAVCADTGLEVVFVAPADAGPALVDAIAAAKLAHRKAQLQAQPPERAESGARPPRGVVV